MSVDEIREAARRDRDGARRFVEFACRVDERVGLLGLRGERLARYQDAALLVYRVASRRRRGAVA